MTFSFSDVASDGRLPRRPFTGKGARTDVAAQLHGACEVVHRCGIAEVPSYAGIEGGIVAGAGTGDFAIVHGKAAGACRQFPQYAQGRSSKPSPKIHPGSSRSKAPISGMPNEGRCSTVPGANFMRVGGCRTGGNSGAAIA